MKNGGVFLVFHSVVATASLYLCISAIHCFTCWFKNMPPCCVDKQAASRHCSPEPWNGRSIQILPPWSKQHIKVKSRQQVYSVSRPVFCQQGVPGFVWCGSSGRAGTLSLKRFVLLISADCLLSNRPLAPLCIAPLLATFVSVPPLLHLDLFPRRPRCLSLFTSPPDAPTSFSL